MSAMERDGEEEGRGKTVPRGRLGSSKAASLEEIQSLSLDDLGDVARRVFAAMGYAIEPAQQYAQDMGDLVLTKDRRTALARYLNAARQAETAAVEAFHKAVAGRRASRGYLISPRGFSLPAQQAALGRGIVLVDGVDLVEVIGSLAAGSASTSRRRTETPPPLPVELARIFGETLGREEMSPRLKALAWAWAGSLVLLAILVLVALAAYLWPRL